MTKQLWRGIGLWSVLLALAATAFAAARQPATQASANSADQTAYTYVTLWGVPRADWSAVEKYDAGLAPVMKKLTDAGTLTGWGFAHAFVHDNSGTTHFDWFTAPSFAALSKALDAIRAAGPFPAAFANAKHHDEILRSTVNGGKPAASGTGMLWVASYELQSGQTEDFSQLFADEIKPLFEEQVAAGTILGYSLNFQAVHTGSPNAVSIAYVLPDAAAIDRFQAALEGYETKHPRAGAALEAVMNLTAHRDALYEVLAFGQK